MLSLITFLPLAAATVLALAPVPAAAARAAWLAVALVDLAAVAAVAATWGPGPGAGRLALEERVAWLPAVGSSYHVGLDGLSLPLVVLTDVVFAACAVHALREGSRPRAQAALFLALQSVCLATFAAQDLLVFFVFFDLSIVGMYFVIAGWGQGDAARSALQFFLYTFLGSLVMLLGFLGLWVAGGTFDIPALAADPPLAAHPATGALVLAAVAVGLAVKTPTVPFHTWLPPAHTDAPAVGSAVLAGVLLKLGTYGFLRVALPLLPQAWRAAAWVVLAVGVVSVVYGALLALGQRDLKRVVACTSVNHMGYVVLAVGAAGLAGSTAAREAAVTGAVVQMVSHGLITTALFLLLGVLHERAGTYALDAWGGLSGAAPRLAVLLALAAGASFGLPGFSGFVAEVQVLAGSLAVAPVAAVALLGLLLTAGLFLRALQRVLAGPVRGASAGVADLRAAEAWAAAPLLALSLVVGLVPAPLLAVVAPASAAAVAAVDAGAAPGGR